MVVNVYVCVCVGGGAVDSGTNATSRVYVEKQRRGDPMCVRGGGSQRRGIRWKRLGVQHRQLRVDEGRGPVACAPWLGEAA